jgi:hypothetical protein
MDHQHIADFDLVDRYLMGKLPNAESSEFEEHFVDCDQCIDQLKLTKAFIEELRLIETSHAQKAETRSATATRSLRVRLLAGAAGVLFVIALTGAVIVFNQNSHARTEADQAKIASTEWERRYEQERQSSAAAESSHQEKERELSDELSQLRTQLADVNKHVATGEINVPVLALTSTRGAESQSGSNELILPASPTRVFISLSLEGETNYRDYRVTIFGGQRQLIWTSRGLKPSHQNAVSVLLDSRLFQPGNYAVTLEGIASNGSFRVVGQYSFRARKK